MTELLRSAITEGSRKTYERAWRMYVDFATDFGEPGCSLLPVSVNSLTLFISYPSARKFASSTILTYVSAFSYVHKLSNLPDPSKNFLVQKLLTANNGLHSAPHVRLPTIRSVLNHTNSSAFQRLLYKTMFLVAFYGYFRLDELTAKRANLRPLVHVQDLSSLSICSALWA